MKLLDMEIGKVYEENGNKWRRTERGIECRSEFGEIWNFILPCVDVTEVQTPHEWTPDELAVFRLISEDYKWIAKDENGDVRLFDAEPKWQYSYYLREGKCDLSLNLSMPSIKPGEKYQIQREEKR